jgi:hypothetical protein
MADQNIKVNINLDLTEFNKNAKAMSDALSKVLGKDVKMFADDMKKAETSINGAEKALKGASSAAGKAGGEIKQGNRQWTNFALIIQDLPYGFRGIQNNLPAVIGGFAGMTGPIYLATSALIAFFTAWDAGFFKTKNGLTILQDANKEYAESLKSSMGSAGEEISKMQSLVKIAGDAGNSMDKRLQAVKQLQSEYPAYFGNLDKETILNGNVKNAVDGVKSAIIERAKATAIAGKINKLSAEKFAKEEELYQLALQKTFKIQKAIQYVNQMKALGYTESAKHLKGLIDTQIKGIRDEENAINATVDVIDKELTRLDGLYQEASKNSIKLETDTPSPAPKEKVSTKALDALKSQAKLYEDDLFTRRYYNLLVLDEEERVALKQAEIDKVSKDELAAIAEDFKNRRLLIEKQTQEGISQIRAKGVENQAKFEEDEFKKVKEAYDKQLDVFDEFYKNKQNLGTGDRLLQKSIYEQEASDLQFMLDNNLISYQDYINRLGVVFKGWSNNNKAITQEAASSIIQIGNGIMSALGPSMDMLLDKSANIGEVLQKMFTDLLKQLIKVAATAAITALLMTIIFPEKLATAGITGGDLFSGLFTQGMGLGSMAFPPKKMANGGLVSGPTMGLMGEYPGASHNPEVIAPLDKLKTLIGGGSGGQFVLRGQDLLLSVNRAQKASNLKGQNISLA